ncbi:MAG: TolC family protein [Methyloprofundus sp.]|nr:TolC family protein [Methyloprofundus sp.]
MPVLKFLSLFLLAYGGLSSVTQAESSFIVDHVDEIHINSQLTVAGLVSQTVEKYPDSAMLAAMYQESEALQKRGSRWLAGAASVSLYYKDDFAGSDFGAHEFEGMVQVPLWNWGQRDAGLYLGEQAEQSIEFQEQSIRLVVAGLVRQAVWGLKLEEFRHGMIEQRFHLAEKLFQTVEKRVRLGDLAKADLLLAKSELLRKKTQLIKQEAELMHARKGFSFLTKTDQFPEQCNESLSTQTDINLSHPALAAINAVIAKQKAEIEWIKAKGSGQTTFAIGGTTERGSRHQASTDSLTFNVNIPFGGSAYLAPNIAKANNAYVHAEVEKAHLYRRLSAELHEAEHALEVERANLEIVDNIQSNAQEHLRIASISFKAGEMNLMDFLRVQERSQRAIENAQESAIRLQRNIAFYNQALGLMP